MFSRRKLLFSSAAGAVGSALLGRSAAAQPPAGDPTHSHLAPGRRSGRGRTPVTTPNGMSLPYRMENGVKVFHLTAEPVKREFVDGFNVNCWGYNGMTPGPTIEAFEGDRVRIYVTNK